MRDGDCLMLKTKDVEFTQELLKDFLSNVKNVNCVGIMHSDISVMDEALCVIEHVWNKDLPAYPDCGTFADNIWTSSATEKNEDIICQSLLQLRTKHPNLKVIGRCCGSFIKKLNIGKTNIIFIKIQKPGQRAESYPKQKLKFSTLFIYRVLIIQTLIILSIAMSCFRIEYETRRHE